METLYTLIKPAQYRGILIYRQALVLMPKL